MERVCERLGTVRFDRVLVSPLTRSRESGEIVRPPPPPATVVEAFTEIDFGDWEGWTAEEVERRAAESYRQWRSQSPDWGFPGGETRSAFHARVASAARELFDDGAAGRVLAVLHKGVCKVILGTLLGEEPEEFLHRPCELGSIHHLVRENGHWRLDGAPQVDHLGPDRIPESR